MTMTAALLSWQHAVQARDNGQYVGLDPEMKRWFKGLSSEKGPCCADADGSVIKDSDWESRDGHYRVRVGEEWVNVPDDALVKVPNRYGPTMLWLQYYDGHPVPRCFMPGSMT